MKLESDFIFYILIGVAVYFIYDGLKKKTAGDAYAAAGGVPPGFLYDPTINGYSRIGADGSKQIFA